MIQLKALLFGLGAALLFVGFDEFEVGQGATQEPQPVELAEIEAGRVPDNTHLQIDAHWIMGHELVFQYTDDGEVTDATKIDHSYYPALSPQHPFFLKVAELAEAHGGLEQIPDEVFPEVERFSLLVKTERYESVGELPDAAWDVAEPVSGLLVNRIRKLGKDERELLAQSFPGLDLGRVLILEEGRKPASAGWAFGLMGGGAALVLTGCVWVLGGMRRSRAKPEPDPLTPTSPVPPIG